MSVAGCGLFGTGSDDSRMTIKNKGCEVEISQHGKVSGTDQTEFSEDITVLPDCSVTVNVKDGVKPATKDEEEKAPKSTTTQETQTEEKGT